MTLIEIDPVLCSYWKTQKETVIEKDVLKVNLNELNVSNCILVGNLPYQISSSLVIKVSTDWAETKENNRPPSYMIFMFQREVAQRILSQHSRKEYGILSVLSQVFWDIKSISKARPSDFYPKPQVSSEVLCLQKNHVL